MDGTSKIELDKNTMNILLQEFASRDGVKVRYENGKIVVNQAGLKLTVTELPLKHTKLRLDGRFGTVNLELADLLLESERVSLSIDVGLDG